MGNDLDRATRLLRGFMVIMIFVLPCIAFYLGMQYQVLVTQADKGRIVAAELSAQKKNITPIQSTFSLNYLNAIYTLEGQQIALVDGKFEKTITPDSATKTVILFWGSVVNKDLNSDGTEDVVFILTQDNGGSGTFYYVVTALSDVKNNNTIGTNGILLGDRIAPQNINIENGMIVVNYADRKEGESMTTRPSIGVSRYFTVVGGVLRELEMKI